MTWACKTETLAYGIEHLKSRLILVDRNSDLTHGVRVGRPVSEGAGEAEAEAVEVFGSRVSGSGVGL